MSFITPDHLTASGSMIGGDKYMSRLMRDVWIEMTIGPAILGKPLLVTHPQGVWIEDDKMGLLEKSPFPQWLVLPALATKKY